MGQAAWIPQRTEETTGQGEAGVRRPVSLCRRGSSCSASIMSFNCKSRSYQISIFAVGRVYVTLQCVNNVVYLQGCVHPFGLTAAFTDLVSFRFATCFPSFT